MAMRGMWAYLVAGAGRSDALRQREVPVEGMEQRWPIAGTDYDRTAGASASRPPSEVRVCAVQEGGLMVSENGWTRWIEAWRAWTDPRRICQNCGKQILRGHKWKLRRKRVWWWAIEWHEHKDCANPKAGR